MWLFKYFESWIEIEIWKLRKLISFLISSILFYAIKFFSWWASLDFTRLTKQFKIQKRLGAPLNGTYFVAS